MGREPRSPAAELAPFRSVSGRTKDSWPPERAIQSIPWRMQLFARDERLQDFISAAPKAVVDALEGRGRS
jgi:hypothetical protein